MLQFKQLYLTNQHGNDLWRNDIERLIHLFNLILCLQFKNHTPIAKYTSIILNGRCIFTWVDSWLIKSRFDCVMTFPFVLLPSCSFLHGSVSYSIILQLKNRINLTGTTLSPILGFLLIRFQIIFYYIFTKSDRKLAESKIFYLKIIGSRSINTYNVY